MAVESAADQLAMLADFGLQATVQGVANPVTGIFDDKYQVVGLENELIDSADPVFLCRASDVPGITNGQTVTIATVVYKVRSVQPDGTGLMHLVLSK